MATNELAERVQAEITNYNHLVLNHSISPLEDPTQLRKARKTIARMKTVLRERELNK